MICFAASTMKYRRRWYKMRMREIKGELVACALLPQYVALLRTFETIKTLAKVAR